TADSRGFSQEELKELFVLKKTTKSDTYDKLKRRRATTTTSATVTTTAATVISPRSSSSRRYQDTPLILHDGSTNSSDGGSFAAGPALSTASGDNGREMDEAEAAADPVVSVDERWKAYEGPSDISDKVLRWALQESCTSTEGDGGAVGNASEATGAATAAGTVVTFVREVLRGGGPEPPPPREIGAGCDPVAAQKGRERLD
ncbi:unnamed protein product, partial [Laminaria digitata]